MESSYSTIRVFVIRPKGKGFVTKLDQRKMRRLFPWSRSSHAVIHFHVNSRDERIAWLKGLKLSKQMLVTEVPEACWLNRHKLAETIPGTGIHATRSQLENTFEI